MTWWSRKENCKSDFQNGLFSTPAKKPKLEPDFYITDIHLIKTKEEEGHPKKAAKFEESVLNSFRPPLGSANLLRFSFTKSTNIFDSTALEKYRELVSLSNKSDNNSSFNRTSKTLHQKQKAAYNRRTDDSLKESGFSKLFDSSVLSAKGGEMGQITSLFRRKHEKQEPSPSHADNLQQIVDSLRLPTDRKLVPYDDSMVADDTQNGTIDLSYIDSHPPPQRSPPRRAVEVQPIPVDNDNVQKGLNNSRIRQLDSRRFDSRFLSEREGNRRRAEIANLWETSTRLEANRLQNEIQDESRSRLRFGFENLVLDIPKEPESFPQLPPEASGLISSAWNKNLSEDEVFVDTPAVKIKRKDLLTLSRLDWLNDEVINFYLDLVVQRSKVDDSLPKVYAFQTFFYTTLSQRGYAGVKRWTRKVDVFSYDKWIVPVHLTHHWCMAIVDLKNKKIEYYDSLLGNNRQVFELLKNYIVNEMQDKKKQSIDTEDWQFVCRKDIPTQKNGSDCGMFACKFAEYGSRDAPVDFDQNHMPYFRQRIVWEICQQQLL